jgi:hypothetical protein
MIGQSIGNMLTRHVIVWCAVGISALSLLVVALLAPVYCSWSNRSEKLSDDHRSIRVVRVVVEYSWIMQKLDYIYCPLMEANAAMFGFQRTGGECLQPSRTIVRQFFCPAEIASQ